MSKKAIFFRWLVVTVVLLLSLGFISRLEIRDNALDLLPDGEVRTELQLLQETGLLNRLVFTLTAPPSLFADEKVARQALEQSGHAFIQALKVSNHYSHILGVGSEQSIDPLQAIRQLPLLLDGRDLNNLEKSVSSQKVEAALKNDLQKLQGVSAMLYAHTIAADPLGLSRFYWQKLRYLQSDFSATFTDGFLTSRDGRSLLIVAESAQSLMDSAHAKLVHRELQGIYVKSLVPGVEVHLLGSLPHTLANNATINHDLRTLLPITTLLLLLLLAFSLRQWAALAVFAVPMLAALPAIAISAWLFKGISGIALGFGIVLLGIAVDFSIHIFFALRSGEQLRKLVAPISFASLTTLSVFVVILFSAVPSQRQMASLAFFGIILGLLFAWLLIPTVVKAAPSKNITILPANKSFRGGTLFFILWLLLLIGGALSWSQLRYDSDLKALDVPNAEVTAAEKFFAATWGKSQEKFFVVAMGTDQQQALENSDDLFAFLQDSNIEGIQTISSLLPSLKKQEQSRSNWQSFWAKEGAATEFVINEKAAALGFSAHAFAPFWKMVEAPRQPIYANDPSLDFIRPLINFALRSSKTIANRPAMVVTTLSGSVAQQQQIRAYTDTNKDLHLLAGYKWKSEVEKQLKTNIVQLSAAAMFLVFILLFLLYRSLVLVLAVFAPVLAALSGMVLFCVFSGATLNMMHLIMGIMVIGLTVDYGIFAQAAESSAGNRSSTRRAVSTCALSSIIGFGVLVYAQHPALRALGQTVLVGIGLGWPVALYVTPYIGRKARRREK